MLRTTESYSERDLTMSTLISLYMRAAYRREQNFTGVNSALRSSAPQRPAPQPRRPPAGQPTAPPPPTGAAPRVPPAPRAPQRAPGTSAAPLPPREPADESCLLPNLTLTGPSVMSPAQRATNRKDPNIRCHNCMDDPTYPKHPPSKCWCLRWDGAPWYHPHEPVARLEGGPVVAPAVLPDPTEQPPGAVPHLAPALPGYTDEEVPDDVSPGISMQPPDPAGGSSIELRSAIAQANSTCLAPPAIPDPTLDPTPDPTDAAQVPWGGVAMFVTMMGMWGVMHACCSLGAPLVLTAPVVMFVVLLAAIAQYVSDSVCTRARSAVVRVCYARSKHAPY